MTDFVFLGCPTYNNLLHADAAQAIYQTASRTHNVYTMVRGRGLTSPNCNAILCAALNARMDNPATKWLAILHADVGPEAWWIDKLIAEADQHKADVVSAVIPLKNGTGITSTALATDDWTAEIIARGTTLPKRFGRLTMRQVMHSRFPTTFGINECCDALAQLPEDLRVENAPRRMLLNNPGCMIVRLTANIDWSKVPFGVLDGIMLQNGRWVQWDVEEGWMFIFRLTMAGAKVMSTKAVRLKHLGVGEYLNDRPWGTVGREVDGVEAR